MFHTANMNDLLVSKSKSCLLYERIQAEFIIKYSTFKIHLYWIVAFCVGVLVVLLHFGHELNFCKKLHVPSETCVTFWKWEFNGGFLAYRQNGMCLLHLATCSNQHSYCSISDKFQIINSRDLYIHAEPSDYPDKDHKLYASYIGFKYDEYSHKTLTPSLDGLQIVTAPGWWNVTLSYNH